MSLRTGAGGGQFLPDLHESEVVASKRGVEEPQERVTWTSTGESRPAGRLLVPFPRGDFPSGTWVFFWLFVVPGPESGPCRHPVTLVITSGAQEEGVGGF